MTCTWNPNFSLNYQQIIFDHGTIDYNATLSIVDDSGSRAWSSVETVGSDSFEFDAWSESDDWKWKQNCDDKGVIADDCEPYRIEPNNDW